MTGVITETRSPSGAPSPRRGGSYRGCTEPPGAPGRGAAGELADGSPARRRKAFYIGNLATGAAGRISPLRPVWDSEIHPARGHCMTLREGIRPTRPPIATRVALFGGLLHPHAALEGPSITSPGAQSGRETTSRRKTWPSRPRR
jgi:hypothetical protein